ncbi:hypothetical protein T552_00039 [Pneumocystis carinii B80]|uniref:Condensin complex subunit 2 n=1 Tax=Pneumocystis carinii (strain B80) TaxID=1408658 RepID=A0A0W4ZSQ3_PNEC8|nr:hypothetical protein T552_00039 [Pneumocystis carinii B80]KTW31394.1 hypothetical protein T552_00039 [Pneumocystis carinii B80]
MVNQHKRALSRHQFGSSSSKRTRVPSAQHVPLNDDVEEKQLRRKERTEHDEKNRNMLITPSTPYKQMKSRMNSPNTTNNTDISFSGFTSAPKVPILANFEEWMKMATDNKINATNSWNFALIDYFHEMTFLREGDGINFQKASCTLDGCVKIYTSRVDSAATETGKLLSGLTCGKSLKVDKDDQEEDGDNDMNAENAEFEKQKKNRNKRSEATLVKDFSALQIKKFDLEFSVDPLFKKVSADFDEGGAKGLLLNHLFIDRQGRIVFDTDDAIPDEIDSISNENIEDIDLSSLQEKFMSIMSNLDNIEICPSFKNLNFGGDFSFSSLKIVSDFNEENGNFLISDTVLPDEDGSADEYDIDNKQLPMIIEDNSSDLQQCNVWGEDTVLNKLEDHDEKSDPLKVWNGNDFSITMDETDDKIFEYFDQALKRNWVGPEHWKIQRLHKGKADVVEPKKQKEKKEPFLIDFFDDKPIDFDSLFSPGGTNIYLPKTQWISKTRNLLPDDIYFNSKQLLRFFTKPKSKIFGKYVDSREDIEITSKFSAKTGVDNEEKKDQPTYDASFFNDQDIGVAGDIHDDDYFSDAKEEIIPNDDEHKTDIEVLNSFITSFKPKSDQLNYAKTAKKVDVKQLKEHIWKELDFDNLKNNHILHSDPKKTERKFTDILKGLKNIYSEKEMADISISFCFICLLHLANEKGLIIQNNESLTELKIMLDTTIKPI